jgi:hypothetical protein
MFQISAGGKLLEAKGQIKHGGWGEWLDDNFHLSYDTAKIWMDWWEAENVRGEEFPTASEFRKRHRPASYKPTRNVRDYDKPLTASKWHQRKEMQERATAAKFV